jgi:hypothetical protein
MRWIAEANTQRGQYVMAEEEGAGVVGMSFLARGARV